MIKNNIIFYENLKEYFEYGIQFYSSLALIFITTLCIFIKLDLGNTLTLNAQIGEMFIFFGLLTRIKAKATKKFEHSIRIAGVFALCRHPFTLSSILCMIGINLVVYNSIYFSLSFIPLLLLDIMSMLKYEKIRSRKHKEIWNIYKKTTNLIVPIPKRYKEYKMFRMRYRWIEDYRSIIILITILINLILINIGHYYNK